MDIIDILVKIGIPAPVGVILLTGFFIFMVNVMFRGSKPADGAKAASDAKAGAATNPASGGEVTAAISAAVTEYRKQQ